MLKVGETRKKFGVRLSRNFFQKLSAISRIRPSSFDSYSSFLSSRSRNFATNSLCDGSFGLARVCWVGSRLAYVLRPALEQQILGLPPQNGIDCRFERLLVSLPGRVLSGAAHPRINDGNEVSNGAKSAICVGDWVRLEATDGICSTDCNLGGNSARGDGVNYMPKVAEVIHRENVFRRAATQPSRPPSLLASNINKVAAVSSVSVPGFSSLAMDRVLVAAEAAGVPWLTILNKIDALQASKGLNEEDQNNERARRRATDILCTYRDAGGLVLPTSAHTGYGVKMLHKLLKGNTTAFVGLSGVGKSSLLAATGLSTIVGDVSTKLLAGRRTTANAELMLLPNVEQNGTNLDRGMLHRLVPVGRSAAEDNGDIDLSQIQGTSQEQHDQNSECVEPGGLGHEFLRGIGFVIDTPGVKSWRPVVGTEKELLQCMPDVEAASKLCEFRHTCGHVITDRGCALQESLSSPSTKSGSRDILPQNWWEVDPYDWPKEWWQPQSPSMASADDCDWKVHEHGLSQSRVKSFLQMREEWNKSAIHARGLTRKLRPDGHAIRARRGQGNGGIEPRRGRDSKDRSNKGQSPRRHKSKTQ